MHCCFDFPPLNPDIALSINVESFIELQRMCYPGANKITARFQQCRLDESETYLNVKRCPFT